eukprot:TRINITY_DN2551_c0_g1_i1.p1 TRINITY_DN2551_c0_g1~~TRINITY_DN2551_c0_g1_i1.p1  ORF type:complete len:256 (+),score=90.23 TRINITY_DN2551_c0_g1_i1:39-770(+)
MYFKNLILIVFIVFLLNNFENCYNKNIIKKVIAPRVAVEVAPAAPVAPPVKVDFYVMSKCPYAARFEIDFNEQVLNAEGLREIIDLTLYFIANVDPTSPSGFTSYHGPSEVSGDFLELCTYELMNPSPENYTWFDYILCLNANYSLIPNNANYCSKQVPVDYNRIQNCVNSDTSADLLTASIAQTNSLDWASTTGRPKSPTIYINDEFYCLWTGSPCQASSIDDFRIYICSVYTGPKPPGCFI